MNTTFLLEAVILTILFKISGDVTKQDSPIGPITKTIARSGFSDT